MKVAASEERPEAASAKRPGGAAARPGRTGTRPYRMGARAAAAAATGERILDAAAAVFWEQPAADLSLDAVARRADVSVQTVIRRFGGREGLLAAATRRELERIRDQRDQAQPGDTTDAVRVLFDHYEDVGDGVLRMLAAEQSVPAVAEIAAAGRGYHHDWCRRVFGASLGERRFAQAAALTDVLMWKLLRRDQGLSREQAELAVLELLEPVVSG